MFDPSRNPACPACQDIHTVQEHYLDLCRAHPTSAAHRLDTFDQPNDWPFSDDLVTAFARSLYMTEEEARVVLARAQAESKQITSTRSCTPP